MQPGQILGWVEGFKAISDVYSFSEGQFVGTNPALQQDIALINKKPYNEGWIYEVKGQLDNKCVDAEGYAAILNQTIDKMLEQQQNAPLSAPMLFGRLLGAGTACFALLLSSSLAREDEVKVRQQFLEL